ncbi:MAG: hypothetical protein ABJC89_08880 [Acidobacteriota bacterium]
MDIRALVAQSFCVLEGRAIDLGVVLHSRGFWTLWLTPAARASLRPAAAIRADRAPPWERDHAGVAIESDGLDESRIAQAPQLGMPGVQRLVERVEELVRLRATVGKSGGWVSGTEIALGGGDRQSGRRRTARALRVA